MRDSLAPLLLDQESKGWNEKPIWFQSHGSATRGWMAEASAAEMVRDSRAWGYS